VLNLVTHNSNLPQIRILSHTNSNLPQIRILSHTSSNSNLVTQNSNLFEVIHIRFIGIKFELNSNYPYSNTITTPSLFTMSIKTKMKKYTFIKKKGQEQKLVGVNTSPNSYFTFLVFKTKTSLIMPLGKKSVCACTNAWNFKDISW
jgi:hypothetical protein